MADDLRTNPSVFATGYSQRFGAAVNAAAGKDHRLDATEAEAFVATGSIFSEVVQDYFDATAAGSVQVSKLTTIAGKIAEREARRAVVGGQINPHRLPAGMAQVYNLMARDLPDRPGHLSYNQLEQRATAFVMEKIVPARGWEAASIEDTRDATRHWFFALRNEIERQVGEGNAIKIDFDLCTETAGREDGGHSMGIALDRRTGKVLEVYIGREGAAPPEDFAAA